MIKAFLNNWYSIIESHPGLIMLSDRERALLPSQDDMQGAVSAIIRLQRVFSLSANEMYAGNYSGHVGPTLQPMDAYEVGKRGFSDGEPELSVEWLKLVLEKGGPRSGLGSGLDVSALTSIGKLATDGLTSQDKAAVMGLMGRAYLYAGQTSMASELYRESMSLDPSAGDVQKLGHELMAPPTALTVTPDIVNTSILCSRQKGHAVAEVRPYHRCRYKRAWWIPYVTYKEEILSLSPYASVFYDVIYDSEIEEFKQFVKNQLTRCMVESYGDKKEEVSTGRTSDLAWIKDSQLHTAARLSKRVEDMTWLNTDQRAPEGSDSGENYQVVNYGLGGHYGSHYDPVTHLPHELRYSGTRLATFLYYLSDVEKGGQTVFTTAGISVAPVKGAALFWYNYNPAMDLEEQSVHAGCPVLKGHKWIANKWIWTYGNTFRRPCGPSPHTTQRQLERIVYKTRHTRR